MREGFCHGLWEWLNTQHPKLVRWEWQLFISHIYAQLQGGRHHSMQGQWELHLWMEWPARGSGRWEEKGVSPVPTEGYGWLVWIILQAGRGLKPTAGRWAGPAPKPVDRRFRALIHMRRAERAAYSQGATYCWTFILVFLHSGKPGVPVAALLAAVPTSMPLSLASPPLLGSHVSILLVT